MQKYIVEFVGALFVVLTAVMAANSSFAAPAPLAVGAVYAAMVVAGARISGAHFNPAVSLAVLMLRRMNRTDFFYYLVAQFAGAALAALLAVFLLNCQGAPRIDAVTNANALCVVLSELLGAFGLAWVALHAGASSSEPTPAYGFAAGIVLFGLATVLDTPGLAFNPAATLGLVISGNLHLEGSWPYLVGTGLGAAVAGTVFQVVTKSQ